MFIFIFTYFQCCFLSNTFPNQHDLERLMKQKSNVKQSEDRYPNPKSTTHVLWIGTDDLLPAFVAHMQNGDLALSVSENTFQYSYGKRNGRPSNLLQPFKSRRLEETRL
jgi:predicted Mrr-cat superfamily restriction endonuclease